MSESEGQHEATHSSAEEAPGKSFDYATALSATLVRQLLEPQVTLLRWYLQALEDRASRDALEEPMRQTVKALMSACLELLQAMRQYRQEFVEAQAALIKDYLATVEDVLRRIEEDKPPPTTDHLRATGPSDRVGP